MALKTEKERNVPYQTFIVVIEEMGARGKIIRVEVNFLEFIYKFQNIRDSIQGDTSVITLFPWLSIHKNQKLCFSISSIY